MDDNCVTIREIGDIFAMYGIELLTGEAGLDNCVSSISVLELDVEHQNPAWYLGGELVLSTFWMYSGTESIIEAVRMLSDRGVAGLGYHQGVGPAVPDRRIIDAAMEIGFPVFTIPHTMPYSIIFTWVYERIFSKRATTVLESEKINTTLTQALFARDSVDAISQTLSGILQKTTAILDENNSLLVSTPVGDDGRLFISMLQQGAFDRALSDGMMDILLPDKTHRLPLPPELQRYDAVLQQAVSDGRAVGSIVILTEKTQNTHGQQIDRIGLTHSATALAIVQMKRKAVTEAEERLRGDLYSDLLSGTVESEEYVAVRADKLGIPLNGIHCVLEVVPEEGFSHRSGDARLHFGERLKSVAARACGPSMTKLAVLPQSEGYLIILHFSSKTKPEAQEKQIREIYTAVSEQLAGGSAGFCVGVGEALDSLLGLMQSCRQAQRAIDMGRKTTGACGLFFYGQMGIYSLLDVKSIDELHANCLSELSRIENAFSGSEEAYMETLEAYFACSESPTEMAKALGLHVNTVKYRLRRIREALGESFFESGNEKMRVYLLLKMKKLIQ